MTRQSPRVVLITGCSTGIGRATAQYLAGRGWRVIATARDLRSIRDFQSPNITPLALDVTDEDSRVRAVKEAVNRAGRIDALVNNAGIAVNGPLELVALDEARQQFETNVWGPLRMVQLVAPILREQGGGRIVNVTSVMGKLSVPFSGLYAGSKYALEALSDTLRWELNPWHIKVILVEPGFVKTNFGKNARLARDRFEDDPLYERYLKKDEQTRRTVRVGSSPTKVARVIEHALTDKRPRPRYRSGLDAQLALTARSLVPDRLFDFGITRVFGLKPKR